MNVTWHFAKGKIQAVSKPYFDKDNEPTLTAEDVDEKYLKNSLEEDKFRRKLIAIKKNSVTNFLQIEQNYNNQICSHTEYMREINDFKNNQSSSAKKNLFSQGILEKHLFDKDISEVMID